MHRSGTSLVAHALARSGLYLGPESELIPADANNADGYWEHRDVVRLNDEILDRLGGAWDQPPADPILWLDYARLDDLRRDAAALAERLAVEPAWGWKDPRACLTLPFWLDLLPDLRVVVCIRHPLEVADSLERRGNLSLKFSLSLWRVYTDRLLAAAPRGRTIVTRYEAWFDDAAAETRRLARFLGLAPDDDAVAAACAVVSPRLRHHRRGDEGLAALWGGDAIASRYRDLCGRAASDTADRERETAGSAA